MKPLMFMFSILLLVLSFTHLDPNWRFWALVIGGPFGFISYGCGAGISEKKIFGFVEHNFSLPGFLIGGTLGILLGMWAALNIATFLYIALGLIDGNGFSEIKQAVDLLKAN